MKIGIYFSHKITMIACSCGEEHPEFIREEHGSCVIPTSAYRAKDGSWFFGVAAEEHAAEADKYLSGFFSHLGSSQPVLDVFSDKGHKSYSAKEVTIEFLRYLHSLCEEKLGEMRPLEVVMTYPEDFSPARREELRKAAQEAGFAEVELLCESEAAALGAVSRANAKEKTPPHVHMSGEEFLALGHCYLEGWNLPRDSEKAATFFRMSGELGNVDSYVDLGVCYLQGAGIFRDEKKAADCFSHAAEQGNGRAMYFLAKCLEEGVGLPKNEPEALVCYRKAAEKGVGEAKQRLLLLNISTLLCS